MRTQSPVKRHARESGYPASVYKHAILSGMHSRENENAFFTGQQWLLAITSTMLSII
jgi:hypothetical protein